MMPLSAQTLKESYQKSFDVPWPSCENRRRCPACEEWTLFRHHFPKPGIWICCHMELDKYCGYSEEICQ